MRRKDLDKKSDKPPLEKMSSVSSEPTSKQSSNPHTPRNIRYSTTYSVYVRLYINMFNQLKILIFS